MVRYGNLDDTENLFAGVITTQLLDADPELDEDSAATIAIHVVFDIKSARMSQAIIGPLIQSYEKLPSFHRTMSDFSNES